MDTLEAMLSAKSTFDEVCCPVERPRLGFSITTTLKSDSTFDEILGGSLIAVACRLLYFAVRVTTRVVGALSVVLSVNALGRLSFINVKHAPEDTNGKTDTTADGG